MLHLPGKDKMRIMQRGQAIGELDRKLVAMSPTYDIYRVNSNGQQEKIGWIEKVIIALTDSFEVHLEGKGFGPLKPPAAYKIEGDIIDRNFVMKMRRESWLLNLAKMAGYNLMHSIITRSK